MDKRSFAGVIFLTIVGCGVSPLQYVERGNRFYESGKYADAEISYRKAIQKDSRLGEAYYRLGLVELREARPEQAYKTLIGAVSLLPARHDVAVSLAEAAFASYLRNPRGAVYYEQVVSTAAFLLKEDSKSYDGLRLKGYVEMFDRHYPEAVDLLKAADSVKPGQEDVLFALVQCLIRANRGAEAEQMGRALIQAHKIFEPGYDVMYRYYMGGKRVADAEGILKLKIANSPDNVAFHLELAAHYAAGGDEGGLKRVIQSLEDSARFPDGLTATGRFYADLGRYEDALREFRLGTERFPKQRASYQKWMAKVFVAQSKRDEAEKVLKEILAANSGDYDARMMRASINVESGDRGKLNSGVLELEDLAQKKPSDATVHFNLGKARLLAGDYRGALARFRETLRIDPRLDEARLLAADTSIRAQDFSQALQFADESVELAGKSPLARLLRVRSLAGMGSVSQASSEAAQLAKDYPSESAPQLELASLRLGQKDFGNAEAMYRRLYGLNRSDIAALQGLVRSMFLQGRFDAAINLLKAEQVRGGNADEIRVLLADAYLRAEKSDQAADAYRVLSAANPKSAFFHLKLGDALLQQGKTEEGTAHLRTANQLTPKDGMITAMLALGLQRAGHTPEAMKAYREALLVDAENPVLMNNLADLIADSGGDLDEALQLAQNAVRRRPADSAISDTLGSIYVRKNMPDDAVRVLSAVVRQNPAEPVFRYHLATALLQKGDKAEARKNLEAAMANKPAKADEVKIVELLTATR